MSTKVRGCDSPVFTRAWVLACSIVSERVKRVVVVTEQFNVQGEELGVLVVAFTIDKGGA